jgi:phosphatidylglycerol---prolipoprotein diacylglyceryl transferase
VLGIIAGALWVGNFGMKYSVRRLTTFGMISAGTLLILIATVVRLERVPYLADLFTNSFSMILAIFLFFLLGISNSFLDVPSNATLQRESTDEVRGRIYGIVTAFGGGIGILPVVAGGLLADTLGVGKVYVRTWYYYTYIRLCQIKKNINNRIYMFPILFSIGPISVYTAHVLAICSWFIFAFLFWRHLRSQGLLEERIFDVLFYSTIVGAVTARLGFVVLFPQLFKDSILLLGALWVQPGLWLYSGILGVLVTCYVLAKRYNVRFAHIFDAFVFALPWTLIALSAGVFFQGSEVGKVTQLPWALSLAGIEGRRHPVQLYEMIVLFCIGLFLLLLYKRSAEKKWPIGLIGAVGLTIIAPALFALEFLKQGSLYLYNITINQWILMVVFAESLGSVIIKLRRMGLFSRKGTIHDTTSTSDSRRHTGAKKSADTQPESDSGETQGAESTGPVSGS